MIEHKKDIRNGGLGRTSLIKIGIRRAKYRELWKYVKTLMAVKELDLPALLKPRPPGTNPENPGTNPENPGTNPENPGTNPEKPGTGVSNEIVAVGDDSGEVTNDKFQSGVIEAHRDSASTRPGRFPGKTPGNRNKKKKKKNDAIAGASNPK